MYYRAPFKNSEVFDRLIEGLIKTGYKANPAHYYKLSDMNKLDGQDIKKLLFGKTRTGYIYGIKALKQVVRIGEDGQVEFGFRGQTYTGKAWIENDSICDVREQYLGGLKSCEDIYHNPDGDGLAKTEYFALTDYGLFAFSVEKQTHQVQIFAHKYKYHIGAKMCGISNEYAI